jgi:hypothetical protein
MTVESYSLSQRQTEVLDESLRRGTFKAFDVHRSLAQARKFGPRLRE